MKPDPAGDRLAKRHADDEVLLLTDQTWPGLGGYLAEYPPGSMQRGGEKPRPPQVDDTPR
jgi:hypothetical protein